MQPKPVYWILVPCSFFNLVYSQSFCFIRHKKPLLACLGHHSCAIEGGSKNTRNITNRKLEEIKILKQNEAFRSIAWQQSHELRRPVVNLLSLCDLLIKDRDEKEEVKDFYLDSILKSTQELDEIIKAIILLASENEFINNQENRSNLS